MLGGADNPNGELPSYITGANKEVINVKKPTDEVGFLTVPLQSWWP